MPDLRPIDHPQVMPTDATIFSVAAVLLGAGLFSGNPIVAIGAPVVWVLVAVLIQHSNRREANPKI